MLVRLFKCDGCWRITDNFATEDGTWVVCKCGRNKIWQVNPTKLNLILWFLTNLRKVSKLILQDIREKCHGA